MVRRLDLRSLALGHCAALCFSGLIPHSASAQDEMPDPASLTLPPIIFGDDPDVASDGDKFFFFHNEELTYAEAFVDIAECRQHLIRGQPIALPGFVPWAEPSLVAPVRSSGAQSMLATGLILALFAPQLERNRRNGQMRICMERRGYVRYALDRAAYEILNKGEERMVVAMQAKLATGPAPQAPVQAE